MHGSVVESAKTGVHLRLMVSELSRRRPQKVIIMEDNTAAISMAGQGIRHVRNAKHFEVRLRYLQELVDEGKLELRHVSTNEQLGDSMTKPLDETKFEFPQHTYERYELTECATEWTQGRELCDKWILRPSDMGE